MIKFKIVITIFAMLIFFSASAQETTTVNADNSQNIFEKNRSELAGKYGADSVKCVMELSLYREFYKQWKSSKYKEDKLVDQTMKSWSYCFHAAPIVSLNMYIHGERMAKHYITANKENPEVKGAWVDTLMMIYDQRIKYFGDDKSKPEGVLLGRKAQFCLKYEKDSSQLYYPAFQRSFEMMGDKSEDLTLYYYFIASIYYVKQTGAERDLILENYVEIQDVIEYNLSVNEPGTKNYIRYEKVSNNIEKNVKKFASCEKLIALYGPKLEKNPDDLKLAKNIVKFFESRRCTKNDTNDTYFNALAKVHAAEPTPESALSMGSMALGRGEEAIAEGYLEEATKTLSDSNALKKGSAYLLLAEVYRSRGKLGASRSAAYSVLKYKPNEGMAYIIIGDLYTSSAAKCTSKGLRVSYWAAYDKYVQALNISQDEKIKTIARKKMAVIKKSFPENQELFMRNLKEGQVIKVECWINENTKVRAR
ncbi:MAG: hypothetical protein KAG84_02155 [Bacteroidales bacterium]|nr:hypothetical protein [Bacteroidales bacterium]